MKHLFEGGIYFTLTITMSTKQIRRIGCSQSKIFNRVCEYDNNLICADAKPRDVVHSSISMSSSSSGSTVLGRK